MTNKATNILRMDNTNLIEKGCLVNSILAEMCKEKNIYLIYHSRKIKLHHLNRGKLHLNKKRFAVLHSTFMRVIFRDFNWQLKNNSSRNFQKCNSDVSLDTEQLWSCSKTLESIRNDNVDKLIFAHLDINSTKNKSELLKEQKLKGCL